MFDCIVIGGGPAGISAAIYLKRFKLDVLVLMKDYGALDKTDHIEN
jgi:thioredoxin reductase (NADPH)